jgi:hypothetical protein
MGALQSLTEALPVAPSNPTASDSTAAAEPVTEVIEGAITTSTSDSSSGGSVQEVVSKAKERALQVRAGGQGGQEGLVRESRLGQGRAGWPCT